MSAQPADVGHRPRRSRWERGMDKWGFIRCTVACYIVRPLHDGGKYLEVIRLRHCTVVLIGRRSHR